MSTPIGIDALSFHVPSLYLPIEELARARDIEYPKLNKGLGLSEMALCDTDEDVATIAAEAAYKLITDYQIDPRKLGRLYMGTESAVDSAKPTASYVMNMLEKKLEPQYGPRCFRNCDVVDMTFACIGGVDALLSSYDWVSLGTDRVAMVIAADMAKYELKSTGEYTQGAGAVAMTVTANPRLLAIDPKVGVATESVGDFFKPRRSYSKTDLLQKAAHLLGQSLSDEEARALLQSSGHPFWNDSEITVDIFKEEPVFDGPYSNACYQYRIFEALDHLRAQKGPIDVLKEWNHLIFHLPYAYQGRRMITEALVTWTLNSASRQKLLDQVKLPQPEQGSEDWAPFVKACSKTQLYLDFVNNTIERGERASSRIGNMYTASIFMSLLSLLRIHFEEDNSVQGDTVAFFAYGSGSKSKVFTGTIQPGWHKVIQKQNVFNTLDQRKAIDFKTYESLHKKEINTPIIHSKHLYLDRIGNSGTEHGFRFYVVQ